GKGSSRSSPNSAAKPRVWYRGLERCHHRQIGGLHHGRAALHATQDADWALADPGGRHRIAWEVVADGLVPVRDDAVVAVLTAADVDDQVPLAHNVSSRHWLKGRRLRCTRCLERVGGPPP